MARQPLFGGKLVQRSRKRKLQSRFGARPSWKPLIELLEERAVPSTVPTFGANAQHTSLYAGPSQSLNQVVWKTPVDLMPQYSGTNLLIHYGAPLVTTGNTVIVPVKTGAF